MEALNRRLLTGTRDSHSKNDILTDIERMVRGQEFASASKTWYHRAEFSDV